jgi:glycosyltransferase involved in cell wall biosynthesis
LKGIEVCLVCTGNTTDYRNPAFYQELLDFIKSNNLLENIRILGMVDHSDVYRLIRQSIAVINPSLFEGWSTTVEETKSMGKRMILSDIEVHREQNPANSEYFPPLQVHSLSDLLLKINIDSNTNLENSIEIQSSLTLPLRQKKFSDQFSNIILNCISEDNFK